jgi:hypothetical protein
MKKADTSNEKFHQETLSALEKFDSVVYTDGSKMGEAYSIVYENFWNTYIENYLSLIFRKINDFLHRFILEHKSVDFTNLVVNFTILYC